jgi:hypothetical protein
MSTSSIKKTSICPQTHKAPNQYRELAGYMFFEALFDFKAVAKGDLSFKKGQLIQVEGATDEWYQGYYNWQAGTQVRGNFPKNHVRKIDYSFVALTTSAKKPEQSETQQVQKSKSSETTEEEKEEEV